MGIKMKMKKYLITKLLRRFDAKELKQINDYIDGLWILQIRKELKNDRQ
jgi:hypothetical protein